MNKRKRAILSAIIKEHVAEGKTVASKLLVDKYDFSLSPATIRNEMAELEKEGFIYQPHTSAGRIPTEKGWQYYIENFLEEKELVKEDKTLLKNAFKKKSVPKETAVKEVAKGLAELSKDAVFVGFSKDNVYYTGLANLLHQPEFRNIELVYHISEIVDHLDEVIVQLFNEVIDRTRVLVGSENPFGRECGTVFASYQLPGEEPGLLGILGPLRMDYENNLALINYTRRLFAEA